MSFAVVTDTAANLQNKHVAEYNIHVVPLTYYVDGVEQTCLDTDAFNGDEYYAMIKAGANVTTSQVSPQCFVECFEPLLKEGKDIICINISAGISGTCNSARIAAGQLLEDYPDRKISVPYPLINICNKSIILQIKFVLSY